ncbi:119_t:CDS:2 [Diversispora eburnea]|uniref:119_t:CDS:1 n=1 Tax=Diversispora eburnea TaxID=1213867 RepID=A0A9N8VVK4_9GLOM|nr:119_t:CDS:2 [Diversispora eburnea]
MSSQAKIHGDDPISDPNGSDGGNNQQTPTKRKRLTQACDACRKKKVKCSGDKPTCNNCLRLNIDCTYSPSTRKRGPRVGLVESLEKRLQQMERLLQPLKEQGLVDEPDDQTSIPTAKKLRLNSVSADEFTDITDNQDSQHYSSLEQSSPIYQQSKEYVKVPKSQSKLNDLLSPPNYSNVQNSQSEFINYFPQSPQSSSPASQARQFQLHTPVSRHSPVIINDANPETASDNQSSPIKTEESDDETFIFFGNTSASPGFRSNSDLIACSKRMNVQGKEHLHKQTSPQKTNNSSEQNTPTMNSYTIVLSRQNNEYPSQEIIEHLCSCYFRHIDNQFTILHEATFKRQLRQKKVSTFLILSMCALAARFTDNPTIKKDPPYLSGETFASLATQMIIPSLDKPSIEVVQGIVFLTMHTYGSLKGPRSWMYIGMAIRFVNSYLTMAQELGLHKIDSPSSNTPTKKDSEAAFITKETRRRTFWVCFMLDRFSACALGRPTLIDEEDCDVRFPCADSIWSSEYPFTNPLINEYLKENYVRTDSRFTLVHNGLFAILCSVIILLGRVSQYVNRTKPTCELQPWDPQSEFAKLEREIEEWYQTILIDYKYSKDTFNSNVTGATLASVHLLYYAVVVVLNRPNVALQNSDIELKFAAKSAAKCSAAANQVTSIAADVIHYGVHYMCPFTVYPVFATATIHINDMYSEDANIANAARESLKIHKEFLLEMSPIWAMAGRMNWMVEEMCEVRNEQTDTDTNCGSAFFFDRKKKFRNRTDLMSTGTDAGFVTFWNRANNNIIDTNFINNMPPMGFPDQLLSPRWLFNDSPIIGDWTNFLRANSPGTLKRLAKKEHDENEYDYFSQDMALYGGTPYFYETAPPFPDMSVGQNLPELSPRFLQTNRQAIKNWADISSIDSFTQAASINTAPALSNVGNNTISQDLNSIDTSINFESSNVNDVNNQGRSRTTEIRIDPILR